MPPRLRTALPCAVLLAPLLATAAPGPAAADGRPLPASLSLPASTQQVVTVTSPRWSDTRATLRAWERRGDRWRLVRGPVRVRLGYGGWVRAGARRQGTGTTPAGRFALPSAFGVRPDPGSRLPYRRVDGDDWWPYEPRDPATYNVLQPSRAAGTRWRPGYAERLAGYRPDYAHAVVVGFNLPRQVRWSPARRQYVAGRLADTRRGGGIFLHVQDEPHTAGCVAAPAPGLRALLRWLDPAARPRIVMGPRRFVVRRL